MRRHGSPSHGYWLGQCLLLMQCHTFLSRKVLSLVLAQSSPDCPIQSAGSQLRSPLIPSSIHSSINQFLLIILTFPLFVFPLPQPSPYRYGWISAIASESYPCLLTFPFPNLSSHILPEWFSLKNIEGYVSLSLAILPG